VTPEETREPRFRERRSAFSDANDTAPEAAAPPEPRPEPPAPAPPEAPAPEPHPAPSPGPAPGPESAAPAPEDDEAALEPAAPVEADFDRLAGMEIPPASFLELVQPLEIQALQFLGEIPLTEDGARRILPQWARHVIDLLGLLEERTRGNLPEAERAYLEQVLADLRMRYLKVAS
jgi:hypothetical protein